MNEILSTEESYISFLEKVLVVCRYYILVSDILALEIAADSSKEKS